MKGFPVCSVRVFWWSHYYKYGMSDNPQHKELIESLLDLDKANQTSNTGILCVPDPWDLPRWDLLPPRGQQT